MESFLCAIKNLEVRCYTVLQPMWWYSHCCHNSCNDSWSIAANLQNYYFLFPYSLNTIPVLVYLKHKSSPLGVSKKHRRLCNRGFNFILFWNFNRNHTENDRYFFSWINMGIKKRRILCWFQICWCRLSEMPLTKVKSKKPRENAQKRKYSKFA